LCPLTHKPTPRSASRIRLSRQSSSDKNVRTRRRISPPPNQIPFQAHRLKSSERHRQSSRFCEYARPAQTKSPEPVHSGVCPTTPPHPDGARLDQSRPGARARSLRETLPAQAASVAKVLELQRNRKILPAHCRDHC